MRSSSFLLLTGGGLLLAAASIFAAPVGPSPNQVNDKQVRVDTIPGIIPVLQSSSSLKLFF